MAFYFKLLSNSSGFIVEKVGRDFGISIASASISTVARAASSLRSEVSFLHPSSAVSEI